LKTIFLEMVANSTKCMSLINVYWIILDCIYTHGRKNYYEWDKYCLWMIYNFYENIHICKIKAK
jgi:hypothetical protein